MRFEFGTVTRVVNDRGFGFARTSLGEEIFVHFSRLRNSYMKEGKPWLASYSDQKLELKVGDKLFIQVEMGDRGPRAQYWGFDPEPKPWNYVQTLEYRRWPTHCVSAIKAFHNFIALMRGLVADMYFSGFHEYYMNNPKEQAHASHLANAYADERVGELLKQGRPWTAIAALEMVRDWGKKYKLTVNVDDRLERVKLWPKPQHPAPLERVVRDMLIDRDLGKPSSANNVRHEVYMREQERMQVERARIRSQSLRRGMDAVAADVMKDLSRQYEPITLAFSEDPALVFLDQTCLQGHLKSQSNLMQELYTCVVSHNLDAIHNIWDEYHRRDERFCIDSSLGTWFRDLAEMGMWRVLRIVALLLEDDIRYHGALDTLNQHLPLNRPIKDDPDRFDTVEKTLRDGEERGYCWAVLEQYRKYVIAHGDEVAFLKGRPDRVELLRRLKAQQPLDELMDKGTLVANGSGTNDELLKAYQDAAERLRNHPKWPQSIVCLFSVLAGSPDFDRAELIFPEEAKLYRAERDKQLGIAGH